MTKSVGVHEAKTHLSRLLVAVAAGETVEITRRGAVVALLVAPTRPERTLGLDAGRFEIPADFDHPLPDEVVDLFER